MHNNHDMETLDHSIWEVLLHVGKLDQTDEFGSETCFRKALQGAENRFGKDSPEAGLCMIELSDLLEHQGRQAEADSLSKRYRSILCRFARELSLV